MARIEILVEEPSMKEFLTILLPKILDHHWGLNENYFIRSFEGKNDLQKNIPSKVKFLSNWNHEAVGVVIMQDQDSSDCKVLKQKLIAICNQNGNCPKLVRIICRELESWYLGDFVAINEAYPNFKHQNYINKSKFRIPDNCNAFDELKKILPEFQKVGGAKKIASFININENKSESFKQTVTGLIRFFESVKD
ncbi:DUF4276 family protein [Flavobacterium eburneipallidum]|uniref:DUF4276 family protein n=1 Tax=Flavobacterium eburneipallidum TaxID=3003263 RepID=UPI00248234F7|nr:DUF4276 family protein [Flavobacterium eburneipallidum]